MNLIKNILFLIRYNATKKVLFYSYLFLLIIRYISIKSKYKLNFKASILYFHQVNSDDSSTDKPLITICIPLYNKITYLERLVLSILQFTNTKRNSKNIIFEMVVIDANSNDESCEFFKNLALILNGQYNSNAQNEIVDKYHLTQFIVNNSTNYNSRFTKIPFAKTETLKYDRSCISLKIYKQNKRVTSNIARQIGVKKSHGIYIWQVDPDDLLHTQSVAEIVDKVSNSNQTDIIEFSFYYHVFKKKGRIMTAKFRKQNLDINSNFDIVKQLLTNKKNKWQLWQCIVKREIYLKALETIRLKVPDQEKVRYATDLFHYIPITYHCNSYSSMKEFGYHYFYRNIGSVSLMAKKNEIDPTESKKIIFRFLETLFGNYGIPIPSEYQEKNY